MKVGDGEGYGITLGVHNFSELSDSFHNEVLLSQNKIMIKSIPTDANETGSVHEFIVK